EAPAAALAFSPWTDLTGSAPSLTENVAADYLLPAGRFAEVCGYYLGGADPADPQVSPLFAAFTACPPLWLQVSRTEILRDDSLRLADRLGAEGVEVEV